MNGYICFYRGKQIEVRAETTYAAQQDAARQFKARKPYEVSCLLAEKNGQVVIHDGAELP